MAGACCRSWVTVQKVIEHFWVNVFHLSHIPDILPVRIFSFQLGNCTSAIRNGVNRVHILDGRIPHCLLLAASIAGTL